MSSKYLQDVEARRPKFIHVYPNGDEYVRATFIVLRPVEQRDLDLIIKAIEEKVRLPRNRPIRKIFEMSGVLVTNCIQIEDGKFYVAASAENFFNLSYGQGIGWVRVGPVRTSKYANVRYVSKSEEEGNSKSLNSSRNMLAPSQDNKQGSSKPKSSVRKTPTSIKKDNHQKSIPKKNMTTSEFVEPFPINDDENKGVGESSVEVKSAGHAQDNDQSTYLNDLEPRRQEDDLKFKDQKNNQDHQDHQDHLENPQPQNNNEVREENANETLQEDVSEDGGHHLNDTEEEKPVEEKKHEDQINIVDKKLEDNENVRENAEDGFNIKETTEIINEEENKSNLNNVGDKEENQEVLCNNKGENGEDDVNKDMERTGDMVNEDNVDQETLDEAATKIQASFRGHRVRSNMEKMKETDVAAEEDNNNTEVKEESNTKIEEQ